MAQFSKNKPPMLGWSDYLTLELDNVVHRKTMKDWLTFNPCAVISNKRPNGPFLKSEVYYYFMKNAQGCDC